MWGLYGGISLLLATRCPNVSEQGWADLDDGDKEVSQIGLLAVASSLSPMSPVVMESVGGRIELQNP